MSNPDPFTRRLNQKDVYERYIGPDAEKFECWWIGCMCNRCYPDPDVAGKKGLFLPRCSDDAEATCLGMPDCPPIIVGNAA